MVRQRKLALACAVGALVALPALSACGGSTARSVLSSHSLPTSVNVPAPTRTAQPPAPAPTAPQTRVETKTATQTQTVRVAPPSPTSDRSDDGGTTWWPWLLIALVVLAIAGVLGFFVTRGRRRNAAWDERLSGARERASWLEGSLIPELQGKATAAEVADTWRAAQPQLLQFDQDLHALVNDAPDDARRTSAATLRERVAALLEAQSAEASVSGAQSADELRSLRVAVDRARAAVRDMLPTAR